MAFIVTRYLRLGPGGTVTVAEKPAFCHPAALLV